MLQLASATATLAGGGVRHVPHLVKAEQDPRTGQFRPDAEPPASPWATRPSTSPPSCAPWSR
jgi:penicillin-binding protein 2